MFQKLKTKASIFATKIQTSFASKKAEGYVDSGVKILIAVVIGALLLAGLYTLFKNTILPITHIQIQGFLNYLTD